MTEQTPLTAALEALPRYHLGNDEQPQLIELSAALKAARASGKITVTSWDAARATPALDADQLVVGISEAVLRVCHAHGIRPTEFLEAIRSEYARLREAQPGETDGT